MATQTKEEKQRKKPEHKPVGERDWFTVKVFNDEYEHVGVDEEMSLFEAQVQIRGMLGVPVPMRRGVSASLSALTTAIRDTTPEKRREILDILGDTDDSDEETGDNEKKETDETESDEDSESDEGVEE